MKYQAIRDTLQEINSELKKDLTLLLHSKDVTKFTAEEEVEWEDINDPSNLVCVEVRDNLSGDIFDAGIYRYVAPDGLFYGVLVNSPDVKSQFSIEQLTTESFLTVLECLDGNKE